MISVSTNFRAGKPASARKLELPLETPIDALRERAPHMTDIARKAAFHRAALLLGIESGADVVQWADSLIAENGEVPKQVLELSTIPPHDLSELRHALEPISARTDSPEMLRALFDIARRDLSSGQRSVKDTITVLAQARSFLKLPEEFSVDIQTLANDHMLAVAGLRGEVAEVESRVQAWLAQFENAEHLFHQETTC